MSLGYIHERVVLKALDTLATGTGGLTDRLTYAAIHISGLSEEFERFAPDLEGQYRQVWGLLNDPDVATRGDEGTVAATIERMSESERMEAAEQLMSLALKVRDVHRSR